MGVRKRGDKDACNEERNLSGSIRTLTNRNVIERAEGRHLNRWTNPGRQKRNVQRNAAPDRRRARVSKPIISSGIGFAPSNGQKFSPMKGAHSNSSNSPSLRMQLDK